MSQPLLALMAANFFMADIRDGIGPFLGILLQKGGWGPASIGLIMTIGLMAAMALSTPIGMLIDATRAKRALLITAIVVVVLSSAANFVMPVFGVVAPARVLTALAGACVAPCVAALTLGIVRQAGYARQVGRNEAAFRAGNAVAAALAGLFGYFMGLEGVLLLLTLMGAGGIAALLCIRMTDIDHNAARGMSQQEQVTGRALPVIFATRPLLLVAVAVMLFHMGNSGMTPLLSQAMVARGTVDNPAVYTALTVLIAQSTMAISALLAGRLAMRHGYGTCMVVALVALPLRGLTLGLIESPWAVVPGQILDGIGGGMVAVAALGLAARFMAGTGHATAGLGFVLTLHGFGSAMSASIGGVIAQTVNYSAAFLALGGIALLGLLVWLAMTPVMRETYRPA